VALTAGDAVVLAADRRASVLEADYVAGGSRMQLAYGVLEQGYDGDGTVEAGAELAARATLRPAPVSAYPLSVFSTYRPVSSRR